MSTFGFKAFTLEADGRLVSSMGRKVEYVVDKVNGIHFHLHRKDIFNYYSIDGHNVWHRVEIPEGTEVIHGEDKSIARRLIVRERLELTTSDILPVVSRDGRVIWYLTPKHRANPELMLAAVRPFGDAIKLLKPEERTDPALRLAAVSQNGFAIQHLKPEERTDPALRLAAVRRDGIAIHHLAPEERTDPELQLAAVCQERYALQYLEPEERADLELQLGMTSSTSL